MTKELLSTPALPLSAFASRAPLLPDAKIILTFERLPSINDYLRAMARDRHIGGSFEKKWRVVGHLTVENWIAAHWQAGQLAAVKRADRTLGVRLKSFIFVGGAYIEWRVWKANKQVKDSAFNLYTKPVEDGFTDAGLWPNDDDRYIVGRTVVLCGVERVARIECHIHDLLSEPHQHTGPRHHHER